MRWFGLLGLLVLTTACGHQPCTTDADCPSDAKCFLKACTKKSTTNPRPEECGDRCEPGRRKCEYEPLGVASWLCGTSTSGCSRWGEERACTSDEFCDETLGCHAAVAEGGPCVDHRECAGALRCSHLEGDGRCQRSCTNRESCEGGEICAFQFCVPASTCDGCADLGERCAGNQAERCVRVDGECFRWQAVETCTGSNVCEAGACVGTIGPGGACSDAARCRTGLACADSVCVPECARGAECRAGSCRVTRAAEGRGICVDSGGLPIETSCRFGLGAVSVPGSWDIGITSSLPPDLFVRLDLPGAEPFTSGIIGDSNTGHFSTFTPSYPLVSAVGADLQLYDSDGGLSGADLIARWRPFDHLPWDDGAGAWSLTLRSGEASLELEVDCAR